MKRSHHQKLAILPLLGILAMSPSVMSSKFASRGIASVEDGKTEVKKEEKKEESKTPKYDDLVSKVDKASITKDLDITLEKFSKKRDELAAKILKEREDFKKDQSDKAVVAEQRVRIESLVPDMLLVEASLKDLQDKKGIEQADDESSSKLISTSKDVIESLLVDLGNNEVLVAKASEPKVEEPKKEEPKKEEPKVAEEPKKDEPKKEEVKKEEVKVTENKDEGKKEEKKEEKKEQSESEKQICALQEQNKLLSKQVEQLINDQKQIMNTFMGMAQMMVGMYQQQQYQQANTHNPYYQNGPGYNSSPYQYNAPMSAGNWVYYPQGFQPQQQNIFAQPQQMVGMYPDQFYGQQQQQGQGQWGLQPQMNFQQQQPSYGGDPRFTQYPQFTASPFGNDAFSFNMTPQVSMMR